MNSVFENKMHVAIFASGAGSNTENLIRYFGGHTSIKIALIATNNKNAGVISVAKRYNIPFRIYEKQDWNDPFNIIYELEGFKIKLIVLAGYLALIPADFIEGFNNTIINIHPALLPKYGGKGMYGTHIHKTVLENKEAETGITIHEVNAMYDDGKILLQEKIAIDPEDTEETIEQKVRKLEYKYLPIVVERLLLNT